MKFGPLPVDQAEGAILAHSERVGAARLRKGLRLERAHLDALAEAGLTEVVVARLEAGDIHEDCAAQDLAQALCGPGLTQSAPFTGRVNLLAAGPGVVEIDVARITAANSVDPMITVATVPPFHQLAKGGMAATVKIIAYGVAKDALEQAAHAAQGAICLRAPVCQTASLILTDTPGGPGDKGTQAVLARLSGLGMALAEPPLRVAHDAQALAAAIQRATGQIVLILTGSATSDIADTAPAALRLAGGRVERFGMPVDPGNLLFLGSLGDRAVIGLPGSARSPVLHGADWVLARVACGFEVTGADIAAMGVGGLLKEIPTRPQPRQSPRRNTED